MKVSPQTSQGRPGQGFSAGRAHCTKERALVPQTAPSFLSTAGVQESSKAEGAAHTPGRAEQQPQSLWEPPELLCRPGLSL